MEFLAIPAVGGAAAFFLWRYFRGRATDDEASDRTAAGVANMRYIETLYPANATEKRLFEDPYAAEFYKGSSIVSLLPRRMLMKLAVWMDPHGDGGATSKGLMALLTGRTKEFDTQVQAAVKAGIKQYVILGAGYDTRAVRLGLPDAVLAVELDQADVQKKKIAGYKRIAARGDEAVKAMLREDSRTRFVPIDFNKETLDAKLRSVPGYDPSAPTVFTMEGVTQYIPKEATAATLTAAASVCGPDSRFIISYVDQHVWDDPSQLGMTKHAAEILLKMIREKAKEPWVTGYHKEAFAAFTRENGFEVRRDISKNELVDEYFVPAGRTVPMDERRPIERYATLHKILV